MDLETEELKKDTPMMEQWRACKSTSKDAVLLFRMGDFYEAFYEDAKILAETLDLTLTKRQGIPMSGVPWHTCEGYIEKLVARGYKVAVAEQVEDPKKTKGLVERKIVRFVTPGTIVSSSVISEKNHNFMACLTQVGSIFGLASLDLSTGAFQVTEIEDTGELANEIYRIRPSETLASKKFIEKHPHLFKEFDPSFLSKIEEWRFDHKTACAYLTQHFQVRQLDGYGLKGMVAAINAAGALLSYVHEDLSLPIHHIKEIVTYFGTDCLQIDKACARNLELTEPLRDGTRKATLLAVLDMTETPMGGRLLRDWILRPLVSEKKIKERQDAVEELYFYQESRQLLKEELKGIRDLERLMMKVSTGLATPRDILSLKISLERIAPVHRILSKMDSELLISSREQLKDLSELIHLIDCAIVEDPPLRTSEGNIFKQGYCSALDELKDISRGGKEWLAAYQTKIREETGVRSLKVSYNKIFGYYIEVSKGQAALMPETFQRRQTLVNSERFISPVLKEYEFKVLSAEDKMQALEHSLFLELKEKISKHEEEIFTIARAISLLDALLSLAAAAKKHDFVRPIVDNSFMLEIKEGRHPVVEGVVGREAFIPNDLFLNDKKTFMLITGPNMAGKSTYIRQAALITILAHMGSFVPAKSAHIGIVDKVFSRVGASDDLSRGQSTFMVEMSETSQIVRQATSRSLVILDEIGRGTGTYDGVSIAWAVSEFLIQNGAKTLFATHYWELSELEKNFPQVVNAHAAVQESHEGIVFLHKIANGGTDKSYGIHVAKLAGLPISIIKRAQSILNKLEARQESAKPIKKEKEDAQLTFF